MPQTPFLRSHCLLRQVSGIVVRSLFIINEFSSPNVSSAQKSHLCRTLCERLNTKMNISPDDVMVMIQFNTTDDWSFSNGQMLSELD
ncbi:tautomerase family protein [Kluyvera ascorbata]|uniref:tautomerase family protein n=1 Tax=Kluyvera ascorbata TaxID=51288 RepID=UPI00319D96D6